MTASASPESAPLAGIRVLDLTSAVVGPYAAKILADYGAEVIKVESAEGDLIRWICGPSPTPGMSGKYLHLNRGKRSIVLDLKQAQGREVVARLLAQTDVLLINMRPKAVARLGLSYADLAALHPRLIHVSMVGFGPGPYRDKPAYDSIIQGGAGMAALHERASGTPRYVPMVIADRSVGLMTVNALMMALFQRERTGRGQAVEVPMFENMAALILSEHLYGASFDPPLTGPGDIRLLDAESRPIKTLDGYISITSNTDAQAFALMAVIGRPELKDDPRFSTKPMRAKNSQAFFRIRADEMAKRPSAEWLARLEAADIPALPYNSLEDLPGDPQIVASGLLKRTRHPSEGTVWDIGNPTTLSAYAPQPQRHAPGVGEQSIEILREASYTQSEIEALLAARVTLDGKAKTPQAPMPTATIPP